MRHYIVRVVLTCVGVAVLTAIPIAAQEPVPADEARQYERADESVLERAAAIMRECNGPWGSLALAERDLRILVDDCSDRQTRPLLEALLDGVREERATHEFKVALFYRIKRDARRAAESRMRDIVARYPTYSRMDEVLYQLSALEYESGRRAEAATTLRTLVTEHKNSPRASEAHAILEFLDGGKAREDPATTPN